MSCTGSTRCRQRADNSEFNSLNETDGVKDCCCKMQLGLCQKSAMIDTYVTCEGLADVTVCCVLVDVIDGRRGQINEYDIFTLSRCM